MPVNLIRSHSLYAGVPYAYAATSAPGSLIFTAGACPLDGNGQVVGVGDVRAQASVAVANLATALAAAGATSWWWRSRWAASPPRWPVPALRSAC